jgi:hypothetical protein
MTEATALGSIFLATLSSKIQMSNRTSSFHGRTLARIDKRNDPADLLRVDS